MVFQIQGFSPNALRPFTVFVPLSDVKTELRVIVRMKKEKEKLAYATVTLCQRHARQASTHESQGMPGIPDLSGASRLA